MTNQKAQTIEKMTDIAALIDREKSGIKISPRYITLNWRCPYAIAWTRIESPISLVRWTHHLAEKGWMNSHRLSLFIEAVCEKQGWQLFGID